MATNIQALVGNNPMIKNVLSNPEHMAKAQQMLRNPEMQKQIGGVISNPAVIKQASEVLSGLQQINTIQAGGRKRFRKNRSRKKSGGTCPDSRNENRYPVPDKVMDCDMTDGQCKRVRMGARGTKGGEGIWSGVANCDGGQAWYDHTYTKYQKNNSKTYAMRLKKFYEAMKDKAWFIDSESWWRSTVEHGLGLHTVNGSSQPKFGHKVKVEPRNPGKEFQLYGKTTTVLGNYLDDYVNMLRQQRFTVKVMVPNVIQSGGQRPGFLTRLSKAKDDLKNKIKKQAPTKAPTKAYTVKVDGDMELPATTTIREHYNGVFEKVKLQFPYPEWKPDTDTQDEFEKKREKMRGEKQNAREKMKEIYWPKFKIIILEAGGKRRKSRRRRRKSKKRKSRRRRRKSKKRKSRRRRRR